MEYHNFFFLSSKKKFSEMADSSSFERIQYKDGRWIVPSKVIIPYIEGDGTGPDIWRASRLVFDTAVEKVYGGKRKVLWKEVFAGEKGKNLVGDWLPEETLKVIKEHRIAIKGPLTTPVGGGIRSLNVALRQLLDLYACIRPVRWYRGTPSPVKHPEKVDMIVFRENTEDVYAGVEYPSLSPEAKRILSLLKEFGVGSKVREDSAIGIKPISPFGSKRLVRKAIQWAIQYGRKRVTLVHKGNIMKFTEGGFREWGYEVAKEEFGEKIVLEEEVNDRYGGKIPEGKILINDRIADNMFQQVLLRPDEYDILATPNLNGDYLSDALAAQVGGLGMAPGGNIGDGYGVFEATHGTAPKYAGKDKVNPSSVILSGALMFRFIGWNEVADAIEKALERTIQEKIVTYDLARLLDSPREVRCSQFGEAVAERILPEASL
jgi:isocitrate dehydrogenase